MPDESPEPQPGIAVDSRGGAVIDPTKNVLDLVQAESKYQNGMRDAESKLQHELANLKQFYDTRIFDIQTVQVKTTSELISTQLDKVTTALGNQITASVAAISSQVTGLRSEFDVRLSQLERFRYETGGRTSVSDPATALALDQLSRTVARLGSAEDEHAGGRRSIGVSGMVVVQVVTSIASAAAVVGVIALLVGHH